MSEWDVDAVAPDGSAGTRVRVEAKTEAAALRKGRAALSKTEKGWTITVKPVERTGP